jgi:hypothetical protein
MYSINLKVGCLHPVACTRSGSGFVLDGNPEPDQCTVCKVPEIQYPIMWKSRATSRISQENLPIFIKLHPKHS